MMSDVMLHGVLNMPIDIWQDDPLDKVQRHSRYLEASKLIVSQQEDIDDLRAALLKAEQERDQYKAEIESLRAKIKEAQEPVASRRKDFMGNWVYRNEDILGNQPLYAAPVIPD